MMNSMWHRREEEELMMCVPLSNREDVCNITEKVNVVGWQIQFGKWKSCILGVYIFWTY